MCVATPVIDGWFTDDDAPSLIGQRCSRCATVSFPPLAAGCPSPACTALVDELAPTTLSRFGTVWSYVTNHYAPPAPYIVDGDEFTPYSVVAVELKDEAMVVLGQLSHTATPDDIRVGTAVELVVERLYVDDEGEERTTWRWAPITEVAS